MIHGMIAVGGDPVLHGAVELDDDALPGGPLPNPTRSLLLGDPAGGALVYGCVIDLDGGEIAGGIPAPARLLFWQPEHPSPPGPVPTWYHRVIGRVTDQRIVDDR
jgi:hypothetical protein